MNRQSALGTATCYVDIDATGKTVVVANYATGSVASFPVRADGSLGEAASFVQHQGSSVNRQRQAQPHAHSINVDANNRFAVAADLGLDKVLVYRLDADKGDLVDLRKVPDVVGQPRGAGDRQARHRHGDAADHADVEADAVDHAGKRQEEAARQQQHV